jgi:cytochrome P450
MGYLSHILPSLPVGITATGICFLLATSFLLAARLRKFAPGAGVKGTRRGLFINVTDSALAHRALVQHSAAFLDRPVGTVPSTILTRNTHFNILSSPYGPYWRALRRNLASNVLHPSCLRQLHGARARVLGDLLRALRSGAPAGESLQFAVYSITAEMCFGADVVSKLGAARLRAMQKFQRDILLAMPSFGVLVRYPRISKLLYRSRWRQLLALRRQQEESFLPLIAEVKNNRDHDHAGFKCYVESLLDLRIHEDGGRPVTDGELVSLVSEFLGGGTESTAAALEWTMANLVKRPDLQQKLRVEVDAIACRERVIDEAELSRMPYLKAVVLESLRRHPPLSFVLRHVEGEEAGKALGTPCLPDVGATVKFFVGNIGLDGAAWSDPADFMPERFMPGGDGEGVDLTCTKELRMVPFGAGRRGCPAIALAMLHLEYFVANLVRGFEWWEVDGDDRVDLTEFRGFFLTTMKHPLRARLVPREQGFGSRIKKNPEGARDSRLPR